MDQSNGAGHGDVQALYKQSICLNSLTLNQDYFSFLKGYVSMNTESFLVRLKSYDQADAIIFCEKLYSFQWLFNRINEWQLYLKDNQIEAYSVVEVFGDFSPDSIALFFALLSNNNILVPLTKSVKNRKLQFEDIAQVNYVIEIDSRDEVTLSKLANVSLHPMYETLRKEKTPGLVLFSSGSTGTPKAAVHDFAPLLKKFENPRKAFRSITFLLFDHIGGINTMLYTLANGGTMILVQDRLPETVLKTVEKHKVELLPCSPTFLNLILLSEAYKRYNLSSLELITYGTEPMLESTLERIHSLFPKIRLHQTYGLSEIGILRSKSKSSNSLWVQIGGEGFETKIVDGILKIKAKSAMLGYLNAPSPFSSDGWFDTGDTVVQEGDFIKILGRKSEIINVGGEKVYPSEVEGIIQIMPEVAEVTVFGEPNSIVGNIVRATIRLSAEVDKTDFKKQVKRHCKKYLENYKVPVKIIFSNDPQFSERFKKNRASITKNSYKI